MKSAMTESNFRSSGAFREVPGKVFFCWMSNHLRWRSTLPPEGVKVPETAKSALRPSAIENTSESSVKALLAGTASMSRASISTVMASTIKARRERVSVPVDERRRINTTGVRCWLWAGRE